MKNQIVCFSISLFFALFSCHSNPESTTSAHPNNNQTANPSYITTGSIERLDERINALIPKAAKIEILAEGFDWAEGPLWVEAQQMLLFSDIPPNKIMKWSLDEGLSTYLHPAGYTGEGTYSKEPGSNGLMLGQEGQLILCQHGDRRLASMETTLDNPTAKFRTIANEWQGKRFNSPNDLVMDKAGNIFFTDPPYGLPQQANDPSREIPFQGVYLWSKATSEVILLTDELSRPNGIGLSPDEQTLYVANSDPQRVIWMAFDNDHGKISNERVFFDASELSKIARGMPDGLKVDPAGNIWATGPGGVLVFSPAGEHLGTIKTGQATANCAFNADYSELYMTADMWLLRLRLR